MDKKKEEFLARLRETFRVEASEHLEAITAGLLEIERCEPAQRRAVVERIFRDAHSLKGAARSVSLTGVESLCQELENIFAAMKREDLVLSEQTLDAIHQAIDVLSAICKSPGTPASPGDAAREAQTLAALKLITGSTPTLPSREAPGARSSIPQEPPPEPAPTPTAAPAPTTAPAPAAAPAPTAAPVPAAAPAPTKAPASSVAPAPGTDTVRVSTEKLGAILLEAEELIGAKIAGVARSGQLRELADELARWNRQRIRQAGKRRSDDGNAGSISELLESEQFFTRSLENTLRTVAGSALQDALALTAVADRLLEDTRKMLLLPCSYLLGALPRILRELARDQGKDADLQISGEDIEIDRRILDELRDPLIHLLRNSVDHGIEKPEARVQAGKKPRSTVTISVRPAGGKRVELTVSDDGAGLNPELVKKTAVRLGLLEAQEAARMDPAEVRNLVFQSGLSTSPIITDLSGRGLGLAIVRDKVERLGGTITVDSNPGTGTTFRMEVPLSLATFRGVLVEVIDRRFAFPTAGVARVCRVPADQIRTIENRQTFALGEQAVSLVRLEDVLSIPRPTGGVCAADRPAVIARIGDKQVAFLVDAVLGEQEMMVKSLGRQLIRVPNIDGVTISGTGAVVPILNVIDLIESASVAGSPEPSQAAPEAASGRPARLLIAEDSITSRTLLKNILEGAGHQVTACIDGMDALTRLKTGDFDLLVSDVDMPRLNGFELTARVRADKNLSALPVVLVTSLGSQKDREYGIEVGANAYIIKSDFDQGNLLEVIRRLL